MKTQVIGNRWVRYVVAVCLLLSLAILLFARHQYQNAYQRHVDGLIGDSEYQLTFTRHQFTNFEQQLLSTISLLSQKHTLFEFVTSPNEDDRLRVEDGWAAVARYQNVFKQIRYVDMSGQEQIKVGHQRPEDPVRASRMLDNISDSHYFSYAATLGFGSIGTLPIELEKADGKLVRPYSPVQYVIVPYEAMGRRLGYIIFDLDFWLSARQLSDSSPVSASMQIVTTAGDYIIHPDPGHLYGFELTGRKLHNLAATDPELWRQMNSNLSGVYHQGDLAVFKRLSLAETGDIYALIRTSQEEIAQALVMERNQIIAVTGMLIIMVVGIAVPSGYLIAGIQQKSLDSKLAQAALNGMSAVLICDKKYLMLKVNREFENITGYTERQIRYGNVRKLLFDRRESTYWFSLWEQVAKQQFWEGELKIRGRAGIELTTITRIQAVKNSQGEIENYIISIVDISERKLLEERLRNLSERDSMTQLWNRRKFDRELKNQTLLRERYPDNHIGCLALVDIDHFKRINDEKGHDEGDRIIQQVAKLLLEATRRTDFVARIGGEEFAIILPHTEPTEAGILLNRIRNQISEEITGVTVSIGYTDLTSEGSHTYKCADIALYESKSLGRNRTSLCHSSNEFA